MMEDGTKWLFYAPVAQWIARVTSNHEVVGSSPTLSF